MTKQTTIFKLVIAGLLVAPALAHADGYYCSFDRKCATNDIEFKNCTNETLEAGISGIETNFPTIFAMEESFTVDFSDLSRDGKRMIYSGWTAAGGKEILTVELADLSAIYQQKFTTEDGTYVDVFYIGKCEPE